MKIFNPEVSVVLVTYNRINFLKKSLESILFQTYRNFELILVNNGCTDGSYELCNEYAKKDERIKLINIQKNLGASRGRNKALEACTGDYISFIDDDDYCDNNMLEFLIGLTYSYDADISICGSYSDFGDRLEPYFIFDELLLLDKVKGLDELLKREKYNVAPPSKLFKRKLFDGISFPEGVLVDDIHVIYKVFASADKVVAKGEPLYNFRKHQSNMTNFIQSNKLTPKLLEEYLSMYRQRTIYLSNKVPDITERAKYSEWSFMISMCDKIKKHNCTDCMEIYCIMVNLLKQNYEEFINCKFITQKEIELLNEHLFSL